MAILLDKKKKVSKNIKEKLIEVANTYFNMDIPEKHPNCSTTYLGMAICNLALTYKITKEKRYLDEAIRFMDGVCRYEKWGNAHLVNVDLSASFILFGLSYGYDYLNKDLNSSKKQLYYKNIKEHAQIIYEYKINNLENGWPTNYWQNHNWINHTALLLAGYVLKNENYIQEALNNFSIVFANLASDGSNYEGITYHRYGGMWLFIAAWLIRELGYKDYFKEVKYLENTFYFRLYSTNSTLDGQLNFGDCHDRFSSHALFTYYLTANIYNDGYAKWYADYILKNVYYKEQLLSHVKPGIMPEMWLCYLAYPNNVKSKNIAELPLMRYFSDLGYVVIRDGWLANSQVFAMKSSYPGGTTQWVNAFTKFKNPLKIMALSHHHPDNLSYIFTKGNDYFVIDDGYNRNISSLCHNSLLVDGKLLDKMDVNDCYLASFKERLIKNNNYNPLDYKGSISNLIYQDNYLVFNAEATNMYPLDLNLKEVRRSVLVKPKMEYIVLLNIFKSNAKHTYESHLNSDYIARKYKNGYLYKGSEYKMYHYVFSNYDITYETNECLVKSIMTTQEPDNYVKTNLYGTSYKINTDNGYILEIISTNNLNIKKDDDYIIINDDRLYLDLNKDITDAEALVVAKDKLIIINGSYLNYNNSSILKKDIKSNYIVEVNNELFK